MRFHQMLHAALAGIFVVPAVTLTSGDARGLEEALTETVHAIESLTGLQTELAAEAPDALPAELDDAVALVLAVTEAPKHDGPEQDKVLSTLRRDVSRLQMMLDDLTSRGRAPKVDEGAEPDTDVPEPTSSKLDVPSITTGLDDRTRAELLHIQAPIVAPEEREAARQTAKRTDEGEAFTADPLRLGHAYYRAGRYAEGLVILSKVAGSVEADYWAARCLEHLERFDEALRAYEAVVADPDAGYLADRAKSDLTFLSWKREFAQRVTSPSTNRSENADG